MKHIPLVLLGSAVLLSPTVAIGQQYGDFEYTNDANAVTIIGYTGSGGAVTVPSAINGVPVTSIVNGVFEGQPKITSLAIPSSVTLIWDDALFECEGLSAINVDPANQSYSSLDGVLFDKAQTDLIHFPAAKAGTYSVPAGVTNIEDSAFFGCTGLVSVAIPSSVSSIGLEAFAGISELTNVFFLGNAPSSDPAGSVFLGDTNARVYYLPGTTGWDWHPPGGPPFPYPDYEYLPAVLWNPQAKSPALRSGQFSFDVTGTPDIPIVIEAATNLTNDAWVPLQTGLLSGGLLHFTDPSSTNFPARFYRIRWP